MAVYWVSSNQTTPATTTAMWVTCATNTTLTVGTTYYSNQATNYWYQAQTDNQTPMRQHAISQAELFRAGRAQEEARTCVISDDAKRKAQELLLDHLSPEQQVTMKRHGWFVVIGGRTGRKYRIKTGTVVANIEVIAANDNAKIEYRLCGHCQHGVVAPPDQFLAQKLMIEAAEDEFLALAIRHAA